MANLNGHSFKFRSKHTEINTPKFDCDFANPEIKYICSEISMCLLRNLIFFHLNGSQSDCVHEERGVNKK